MSASITDLLPYLKKFGNHCMAYTSLEPEMQYFVLDGVGYIAYINFKHWFWARKTRQIVLANPICDPRHYKKIIKAFLAEFPHVIFVEASKALAEVLLELGYTLNQFGVETEIPVVGFDLKGKARAKLRQWRNKCRREGVTVREQMIEDCDNHQEIRVLSDGWVDKKGGSEFSFLVRPLRYQNEPDVRYFWAYQGQKLMGLAVFDPIYQDGKVVAYYHNMDRIHQNAPHGTSAFIILAAIEAFQQEGIEYVSLGMSPLCLQRGMVNELDGYNRFTRKSFWYAFDKLNFIYPFKGNASHKNKFNGDKKPVYICSTRGTTLWEVLVMTKSNGMF